MPRKAQTYYLTCLILLMPLFALADDVKVFLNSFQENTCMHGVSLVTNVYHTAFPENKDDGKYVVVLDAGHGGNDSGALGKNSKEKDIALSITLQLGEKLKKDFPNMEVIFTRKKDVFLPLNKRIKIANKKKADLFVSVHCNYVGNPNVCGTETFVMGLHRAEENLNVAKRENSVVLLENDHETQYDGYDPNSPIGHILLSTYQNLFLEQSIVLASHIETNFKSRSKTNSRGVKQAGFLVLREATMPAVLIETGFLSNPKEEKYLLSKVGQKEMANSITKGIASFFDITSPKLNEPKKINIVKTEQSNPNRYIIQIGVFSKRKDKKFDDLISGYGSLIIEEVNGVFKYAIGYFASKEDAKSIVSTLQEVGFNDAYIKKL